MLPFIVRRLLVSIPLLLVSSFLVFVLVANSGDPLQDLRVNPRVSPATVKAKERELHLDKPVIERYGIWVKGLVKGDFGTDNHGVPVRPQLWRAVQVTLRLVVFALIVAVIVAVLVGVVSAIRQYTAFDYTSTFAAFLFFSLPVFWLAALLKEYGAVKVNQLFGRQLVYTIGQESPNFTGGFFARLGDMAGHTFLPALTLILISFAQYSRYTRSSMLDVLSSDYVRTARAKGLAGRRVIFNHALRNAMIPLVTIVALDFGAVIGGAVVTERVFGWRGMGTMLITGVTQFDVNLVQAWLMITAVVVVLFNLIADIGYAYLDPRIRLG
jgi:peptide/nickel transport system permease protein